MKKLIVLFFMLLISACAHKTEKPVELMLNNGKTVILTQEEFDLSNSYSEEAFAALRKDGYELYFKQEQEFIEQLWLGLHKYKLELVKKIEKLDENTKQEIERSAGLSFIESFYASSLFIIYNDVLEAGVYESFETSIEPIYTLFLNQKDISTIDLTIDDFCFVLEESPYNEKLCDETYKQHLSKMLRIFAGHNRYEDIALNYMNKFEVYNKPIDYEIEKILLNERKNRLDE